MLSLFQIDFASQEFVYAVCGALLLTLVGSPVRSQVTRAWRRISQRPWICAVVTGMVMFGIQAGVANRYGWPVPALHDEFSYLLAADTYASGRATNPTPPGAEFLETYHVLMWPSYQSKYPPGMGLVLAVGQLLTGRPIVGVWICLGLAAAGAYWMLRGWFASRWALLGSLILICNWPVTKLWGQTYFGGAAALSGAILVYGSWIRLQRRPSMWGALGLGTGLLVWAITRPYEGLIAGVIPVSLLVWNGLCAEPERRRRWLTQTVCPLVVALTCGALGLDCYHQQVTGSPWKWPYRLYEETYTRRSTVANTLFSWTNLGTRQRTIPSLELHSSAAQVRIAETKPVLYGIWKCVRQWWFHVGLIWTMPLVMALLTTLRGSLSNRTRWLQFSWAWLSIGMVGGAILLQRSAGLPHYAAPIQPLIMLLIVQGCRLIWVVRIGQWPAGQDTVIWMALTSVLFFGWPLATGSHQPNVRPWSLDRERLQRQLEREPRPSLVIVKYGPGHSMHEEWVYNRANIEQSYVVWVRDLGEARVADLRRYFPGRDLWVVEPDRRPVELRAWTPPLP